MNHKFLYQTMSSPTYLTISFYRIDGNKVINLETGEISCYSSDNVGGYQEPIAFGNSYFCQYKTRSVIGNIEYGYIVCHVNEDGELHRTNGPAISFSDIEFSDFYGQGKENLHAQKQDKYYINGILLSGIGFEHLSDNIPSNEVKPFLFNLERLT